MRFRGRSEILGVKVSTTLVVFWCTVVGVTEFVEPGEVEARIIETGGIVDGTGSSESRIYDDLYNDDNDDLYNIFQNLFIHFLFKMFTSLGKLRSFKQVSLITVTLIN